MLARAAHVYLTLSSAHSNALQHYRGSINNGWTKVVLLGATCRLRQVRNKKTTGKEERKTEKSIKKVKRNCGPMMQELPTILSHVGCSNGLQYVVIPWLRGSKMYVYLTVKHLHLTFNFNQISLSLYMYIWFKGLYKSRRKEKITHYNVWLEMV